jgi:hypothetical protein
MFLRDIIVSKFLEVVTRVFDVYKRYLLWRPNYKVLKAEMEYIHVPVTEDEDDLDPLWIGEKKYWSEDQESSSYVDITKYIREGTVGDIVIPVSIEQCVISIWYFYNDKTYKFFTRDLNFKWPPPKPSGMKFTLPIRSAELLDEDLETIEDVTGKIKKYAGPFNNFFNQEIVPDDMLGSFRYSFLKIVNILGTELVVAADDIIRVPW